MKKDYVNFYNNERPSYALKYKTPVQFKLNWSI
ncbi:MAG: IS3 family transposase [Bacilli bacterium]